MGAASLARSQSALGAFYRRDQARHGGIHAVTATAHKLARIYYAMVKNRTPYKELGQQKYEEQFKKRRIMNLTKLAKSLGFNLTPCEAQPCLE